MIAWTSVSIIGLGYIGLPTAAVIAQKKIKVVGVDINSIAVDIINSGRAHIVEPGLEEMVQSAVKEGYFYATTIPEEAEAFIIAVPTPFKENHQPDMVHIEAAAKAIAPLLKRDNLVILESTSPVGATEKLNCWLADARPDLTFPDTHGEESDIRIAYCPERVLPGHVIRELVSNDRVIGGMTPRCSELAASLYSKFVDGACILTNSRTAEMCKLTENSFRDVNIAFANELSVICDTLSIDVWELIALANRHPRVNILKPGPGVGGHCIAVDPWFIVAATPAEAELIRTARIVNDRKPDWVIAQVMSSVQKYLESHTELRREQITISCFGLAFKPDIDDLRESPAVVIVKRLADIHEGTVKVVEPHVSSLPESLAGKVALCSVSDAVRDAHVKVFLVAHSEFGRLMELQMDMNYVIDACGLLRKESANDKKH